MSARAMLWAMALTAAMFSASGARADAPRPAKSAEGAHGRRGSHRASVTRTLRAQIQRARAADPAAFRQVREVAADAPELDRNARGRTATIAHRLAGLGPRALMPMLDLLTAGKPPGGLEAVRLDLVAAVGRLRDARAVPALEIMLDESADFDTTRTVTEAIARMDDEDAATRLTKALARAHGERARAILAGIGVCHRERVARAIADALAKHPPEATARDAIRSLGRAGNWVAWRTLKDRSQEKATRALAAEALVLAFTRYDGEVRYAASNALMVVDDPTTPALIQAARASASPETAAALDALAKRFKRNPSR